MAKTVGCRFAGAVDRWRVSTRALETVCRIDRLGEPGRHHANRAERRIAGRHAQAQARVREDPGAARQLSAQESLSGDVRLRAPPMWTYGQRIALLIIVAAMFVYLGVRYALNPVYVSNPQPVEPSRAAELLDRIDPNTADIATL